MREMGWYWIKAGNSWSVWLWDFGEWQTIEGVRMTDDTFKTVVMGNPLCTIGPKIEEPKEPEGV
jgi:hypothetical protein